MANYKEDKKKKWYTLLVMFVLFGSVIGFVVPISFLNLNSPNQNLKYGDYKFTPTQYGIATQVNGKTVEFFNTPEQVSSVVINEDIVKKITNSKNLFFLSDPDSIAALPIGGVEFDLGNLLETKFNTYTDVAFTSNNSFNRPIFTCKDATALVPIIFFNYTNSTSEIRDDNNCIVINFATDSALQRSRDQLMYKVLGIE